jgi:TPR repeat protein
MRSLALISLLALAADAWAAEPAAQHDPLTELRSLSGEAAGARAQLKKRPKDERPRERLADLAVRAAGRAEAASAAGAQTLFDSYRTLIEGQLADVRWRLGKRAEKGDGAAGFALGVMALHGILQPADRDKACTRFAAAFARNYAPAKFRAGECLVKTDPVRADALLRESADSGHALANEILAQRCLAAKPPDADCARGRLQSAAALGRPSSQALLAWMYAQGVGGQADPQRAARLYLLAARAGDASAQNNVGELYESGRGLKADPREAIAWYRKAAEAGFAPAQFNLGRALAAGIAGQGDKNEAKGWLEKAEAAGIVQARNVLDWMAKQNVKK